MLNCAVFCQFIYTIAKPWQHTKHTNSFVIEQFKHCQEKAVIFSELNFKIILLTKQAFQIIEEFKILTFCERFVGIS